MSAVDRPSLLYGALSGLPSADRGQLLRSTFASLAVCLVLAFVGGLALADLVGLPRHVAWRGAALFAIASSLVLLGLRNHPHKRFGPANFLTTSRASAAAVLAALALDVSDLTAQFRGNVAWIVAGVAGVAVALDGLDGFLARRRGETSDLGARYDMEVDAFLILVLCVLAWRLEKVGVWVLAIGLMRYAFVAAACVMPWLSKPLPPAFRRKAVCAVQGIVLCAIISPLFPSALAGLTAGFLLTLLAWSFLVDVTYLRKAA